MPKKEVIKCKMCNKGIRPFKVRGDWEARKLHLECWKIQQVMYEMKMSLQMID